METANNDIVNKADKTEGDVNVSQLRDNWISENIDEKTKELLELDAKYFLHQSLSTPCMNVLESCEGSYITDMQGRKYLDFHGNNVHQVGYKHPKVIEAVKEQLDKLPFSPRRYTNEPAIQLAKKLTELTDGRLNKALFAPAGTLAVGMALKLARIVTGRFKTISWWDSFHGASLDSISVGGESLFISNIGPLLPGAIHVPPPSEYRNFLGNDQTSGMDSLEYIEYVFKHEPDIAAFIAEPIRYTTAIIPSKEYWQGLRSLCDKYGALLILDEIPTCLGRTGYMFAHEYSGITPDILCIGKGLGGGVIPMAGILTKEEYDVAGNIALGHYTHEKNPVGAAASLATIKIIEEENILEKVKTLGEWSLHEFKCLQAKRNIIGDVRGIGLLMGVELVKDRATKEPANEEAEKILYKSLSKGLSFKISGGNVLTLMPPLTITQKEMQKAISIIDECICEL
jgi:4-aminobutyrate aminotransferase